MNGTIVVHSIQELQETVKRSPRLCVVGSRSKPRFSEVSDTRPALSTAGLSGIVEYDPQEYTVTALAGTRISQLGGHLAANGQYLPFDPPLVDAGATVGGTVAAGLNGAGRFRYGGIRDFVLGIRFVDGAARCLRVGGRVVKNAAGFDLPKFMVGSLGCLGIIVEATFKVFPCPPDSMTFALTGADLPCIRQTIANLSRSCFEIDALELLWPERRILVRIRGSKAALDCLAELIVERWPGMRLPEPAAEMSWRDLREFHWAHGNGCLLKVPIWLGKLEDFLGFLSKIPEARACVSGGGNTAYVSLPVGADLTEFDRGLCSQGLSSLTIRGQAPLWQGQRHHWQIAKAVKGVLDPEAKFPIFSDT